MQLPMSTHESSSQSQADESIGWLTLAQFKWLAAGTLAAIYLLTVSPVWNEAPDSALYLMLGDNLAEGKGYTLWGQPHVHVPPGFPLIIAGMAKLGLDQIWMLNLLMALMGLAAVGVSYLALCRLTSHKMAIMVAVALGFCHTIHRATSVVQSDISYMLITWAGIYCYLRGLRRPGWWLECGTLAMLAGCAIRVAGFPFAGGVAVGLLLERREVSRGRVWANAGVLLLGLGLTAVVFVLYHHAAIQNRDLDSYRGFISSMASRSNWDWLTKPVLNVLLTGKTMQYLYSGQQNQVVGLWNAVVWIPTLIGLAICIRRRQMVCACGVVAYLGINMINVNLIPRYLVPVAPALILYFCLGVEWLARLRPQWRDVPATKIAIGTLCVMIALHLPKALRLAYLAQVYEKSPRYVEKTSLREAAEFLSTNADNDDRFVTAFNHRSFSYLSDVATVPNAELRFRVRPLTKKRLQGWLDSGVAFIVTTKLHHIQKPEDRQAAEEVCRQCGFKLVYENEDFRVFSNEVFQARRHVLAGRD